MCDESRQRSQRLQALEQKLEEFRRLKGEILSGGTLKHHLTLLIYHTCRHISPSLYTPFFPSSLFLFLPATHSQEGQEPV